MTDTTDSTDGPGLDDTWRNDMGIDMSKLPGLGKVLILSGAVRERSFSDVLDEPEKIHPSKIQVLVDGVRATSIARLALHRTGRRLYDLELWLIDRPSLLDDIKTGQSCEIELTVDDLPEAAWKFRGLLRVEPRPGRPLQFRGIA